MTDLDVFARLYPAEGLDGLESAAYVIKLEENQSRYVPPRQLRPSSSESQDTRVGCSRQDREGTQMPQVQLHYHLEYRACLALSFSNGPKTSHGFVFGRDPQADVVLPSMPGLSFQHFSVKFNDDGFVVVRDLGSTGGTSVSYGEKNRGDPRRNVEWIVGGHSFIEKKTPIIITVTPFLRFQIVVPHFDRTQSFWEKVEKFRMGTTDTEDLFGGLNLISRPHTELGTGAQTPAEEPMELREKLGRGSFGVVYYIFDASSGKECALKEPVEELDEAEIRRWENEVKMMQRVSHVSDQNPPLYLLTHVLTIPKEHIVTLLGSTIHPSPSLRPEDLPGGSLRDQLKAGNSFSRRESIQISRQTLLALTYLHELDPPVAHRDIKPSNILIEFRGPDEIRVKFADFGMAKAGDALKTFCGTPKYLAPDVITAWMAGGGADADANYTMAVDVWPLGVVLAELAFGLPPHKSDSCHIGIEWCETVRRWVSELFEKTRDPFAGFLLDKTLCLEPGDRRSARECYDAALLLPESWHGSERKEVTQVLPSVEDGDEESTVRKAPDPLLDDGPSLHSSELDQYIRRDGGDFERSGAPPPSPLPSAQRQISVEHYKAKFDDPEDSLYYDSSFTQSDGGDSSSNDGSSDSGSITPRRSSTLEAPDPVEEEGSGAPVTPRQPVGDPDWSVKSATTRKRSRYVTATLAYLSAALTMSFRPRREIDLPVHEDESSERWSHMRELIQAHLGEKTPEGSLVIDPGAA